MMLGAMPTVAHQRLMLNCGSRASKRLGTQRAQRFMSKRAGSTVVEAKGSHAIYVSQPQVVAKLIEQAAVTVSKN